MSALYKPHKEINVSNFIILLSFICLLLLNLAYNDIRLLAIKQRQKIIVYEQTLEQLRSDYTKLSSDKELEIEKLQTTLDTTFKDYTVIQTLLNKNISEWTVDSVLGMRDKLASLPYGSWFEGEYVVTAPWGSTLLIGSHWGSKGHLGVDIKPTTGNPREPIISPISGRVVTWGRNDRLFGNYLVIESLDGQFQIKLAHLSSIAIYKRDGTVDLYEGMEFTQGTRLATMGDTGNTTGPHLHLEYYINEVGGWRLLNASAILEYMGTAKTKQEIKR